jgi:hypothetical protein
MIFMRSTALSPVPTDRGTAQENRPLPVRKISWTKEHSGQPATVIQLSFNASSDVRAIRRDKHAKDIQHLRV